MLPAHLRPRRRLLGLSLLVVVTAIGAGDRFASAGNAAASLGEALAEDVDVDVESVHFWGEGGAITPRSVIFRGTAAENQPADLYYAACRVSGEGDILGCHGLSNLTRTSSADELAPIALGDAHLVYASRVGGRFDAFTVLDLQGEPRSLTEGWSTRTRTQNAITNLQQTGRRVGFGRRRYALRPPSEALVLRLEGDTLVAQLDDVIVRVDRDEGTIRQGAERVELRPMEKGEPGTITWVVDTVRDLSWVGPEPIAWLEHRVFAIKDALQRAWYAVAGSTDTEAEVAAELGLEEVSEEEQRRRAELSVTDPELGWPPAAATPIIRRPAEGEGEWIPIVDEPFVRSYPNAPTPFFMTFLQVDPDRPFTRVYVAIWDPRLAQLRIMTGTQEPESATGETGPGMVPRDDETLSRVVAGFNGGFQALHGEFGMMSEGRIYLPPKPWAATVAVHRDGRVSMGSWVDPPEGRRHYAERWAVEQIPEDMVEFRQNLTSVVEDDRWNPWRRWYWGAAPQGDEEQAYIDRSGLCLTSEGFLAYFWGKSMGAEELAKAMLAVRCVRGIHLDMNQRHTAFELYHAYRRGEAPPLERDLREEMEFDVDIPYARGWRARGRKLVSSMTPMRFPRYIRRDPRDFFYLTLKPVLPGPHLEATGDTEGEGHFSTSGLPHAGYPHAFARAFLGSTEEEGRTWLVRIDPSRVVPRAGSASDVSPGAPEGEEALREPRALPEPSDDGGAEPDVARAESDRAAAPRVLGYLTGAKALTGGRGHGLYRVPQVVGQRFVVGRPPDEEAEAILRGPPVGEGTEAALGIDGDGFWVYAERVGDDPVSLVERLEAAGVARAIALPEGVRLAFRVGEQTVAPDAYERPVAGKEALVFEADTTPASEVLFPEVRPRPYMYWGPMQDTRVRYFRDGGPPRFTAPDTDTDDTDATESAP